MSERMAPISAEAMRLVNNTVDDLRSTLSCLYGEYSPERMAVLREAFTACHAAGRITQANLIAAHMRKLRRLQMRNRI